MRSTSKLPLPPANTPAGSGSNSTSINALTSDLFKACELQHTIDDWSNFNPMQSTAATCLQHG